MGLWSGGGFNVSDLMISYEDSSNDGCSWQTPNSALQAAISADCPGAVFVGAGETVPANVPVVVFTSGAADFDYNFSGLCATNGTFYVLQSDCTPANEVFPNTGSGTVTTGVSIGCWSESITYDLGQINNSNGAFVAELPIIGTIYGQAGCGWPSFSGLPGTDPVVNISPLDVTITADQCNNGPYYIVGIYEPLPTGCPQTLTNYLSYDVPCPSPVLGTADLCNSVNNFNLITIQDPAVPNGTWSGDGVTGTTFNATGLLGPVQLTFTPTSDCGVPASTTINISEAPTATIDPIVAVCSGGSTAITINFTGTPDWSFNLHAGGIFQNSYVTASSPFTINVNPTTTTTYSIQNLADASGCPGMNVSALAMVSNSTGNAVLTLAGNDTICSGSNAQVSIDFSNGVPPYDLVYAVNGIPQAPILNISQDPYLLPVTIFNNANISLVSLTDDNGCSGTVSGSALVWVLQAPTAQMETDTVFNCSGMGDTITVNLSGNNPFSFVYQINGINQPVITTDSSHYEIAVGPTVGPAVYTLFSINDSICNGAVSGIYRINIIPSATATLSGMDSICVGQMTDLSIDFTGSGPYFVAYSANGVPQAPIQTNSDPYVFSVSPTSTTIYTLDSLNAGGCSGSVSGTAVIVVPPAASASISGGGQICQGGSGTTVTIDFTGTGPYTFIYSINNVPQPQITTNLDPYILNVNPPNGNTFRLVSMNDAYCSGTVSGVAQVLVFVPASADLFGDTTFCDSAATQVTVNFNGSGPFTIEYSINGVLQPPVFTSDDPYYIPVNVTSTTTYELISIQSPGCVGDPNGTAVITVNYPPSYTDFTLDCDLLTNSYTASFSVINGTAPYTLLTGSGTFTGNVFTSDPIPLASGYNFVFHDANDCGDIAISGPSTCNCSTASGAMNLTLINACQTQSATAIFNGGFVNDGDDVLMYILHTNPAQPLGTILDWNSSPTFTFVAGMSTGVTYYISAIAGNSNGLGQVDLNDPCYKVSQGTPVVFHAPPTANIGVSAPSICAGDSVVINVNLTGTPAFSITPQWGSTTQTPITGITGGSYSFSVFPSQDTVISLTNVSDLYCPLGQVNGAVSISMLPTPSFGQDTIVCDYINSSYTVTFPFNGAPPFSLTNLAGSNTGNVFTSTPIPFGTPYLAYLTDMNNCGADTLSGLGVCSCLSDAGIMSQTLVSACQSDVLTVPDTSMVTIEPGDILMFILHSNPGIPLGTIYAWSNTPSFTHVPGMLPNVTYYVSAIVGNPDGNGQIDVNDPCLSVAVGTPVQWYPIPTAALTTGTFNLCPGQGQALIVSLTGTPNYTLTYTSNGTPFVVNPMQNLFSINAQLQQSATFLLTGVTDANGCVGTVSGQAVVNVHQIPVVINQDYSCDFNTQTYTYEFDVTQSDLSTTVVSNMTGTYDPATGHFTSNPIPFGQPYSFVVTDSWGCGNFTGAGVANCSCVTNAGSMTGGNLVLCAGQMATTGPATGFSLEAGDTLLYYLVSTPSPTTWTILGVNATPNFTFNSTSMMYGVNYYIVAAAGNILMGNVDLNDPCLSSAPGPSVMWLTPVVATLSGADTVCMGSSANLQIAFSGNGPFFLTYTDGGVNQVLSNIVQNPYIFSVTPSITSTYSLVGITGANTCLGSVNGSAQVQVNPFPQALNVEATCDLSTETYTLSFDISNGAASNPFYSVTGLPGSIIDTTFTSLPNIGNQAYQVTITDNIGCSSVINGQPNCVCTSNAGSLTNIQNACLPNGQVSAQGAGDASLDTNDVARYFLVSDPLGMPGSILAESGNPQFGFQTGMMAETVYYIVTGVGNPLGTGNLDFNDPCLSLSAGVPVVFHNFPTANVSGAQSVCLGDNTSVNVQFTGQPPFTYSYQVNGNPQGPFNSNTNTATINISNVQVNQVLTLTLVQDANCDGEVSGQASVTAVQHPSAAISPGSTICLGESATLSLNLTGANLYDVTITGGITPITLNGVQNGATFTVTPTGTTTYSISSLNANGNSCVPNFGSSATVTTNQVTASINVSDYNGFNVSCPNGDDGEATVEPLTGIPPINPIWSNGQNGLSISNLTSGDYSVTLTDQLGCTWSESVTLTAPDELGIQLEATDPVCFGEETGFIQIDSITGGAGPFNLLLNGEAMGVIDTFPIVLDELGSGDYTVAIEDANGCISDAEIEVPTPVQLFVNLGNDTLISFGDSILLTAIHNAATLDEFYWTPNDYLRAPDQLTSWALPLTALRYSIYIRDHLGCEATDVILINVQKDHRVYVPNAIYPLSSQFNNIASVWAGAEVAKVRFMRIFDRWGEMVFENSHFLPNNPQLGWNGTYQGEFVNPAVFVYVLEVEYINGETEVFKGDITVIR